ncbi:MAG TPA: hypothetical protein VIC05_12455 [Solirubrobacteraceae bacterium]
MEKQSLGFALELRRLKLENRKAKVLVTCGEEVMTYMGHADLATTSRYVKRLPQRHEGAPSERLDAYLGDDAPCGAWPNNCYMPGHLLNAY